MTTAPAPTLIGTRTLSERDAGATVVLDAGEAVRVVLGGDFVVPYAEGNAVARSAAGGFPSGNPAEATFTAQRPGRVDLVSETDYTCLHSAPRCALPQDVWRVDLVVVE
jgi:hypothetical protein